MIPGVGYFTPTLTTLGPHLRYPIVVKVTMVGLLLKTRVFVTFLLPLRASRVVSPPLFKERFPVSITLAIAQVVLKEVYILWKV